MISLRWCSVLLVIAISLLTTVSYAVQEPGGATPAEVLKRSTDALHPLNLDELAQCASAYVRDSPDAAKTLVKIHQLDSISRQLVIDGVKKFGAAKFVKALDLNGCMFLSQGLDDPATVANLFITKGKLEITGDKATYTYLVSKAGTEILPAQSELAQYEKAMWGGATTDSISATFVKLNGRWFIDSPESKTIALFGKMYQPFAEYQQQLGLCIKTSKDITAFKAALAKPAAAFKKAAADAEKELPADHPK